MGAWDEATVTKRGFQWGPLNVRAVPLGEQGGGAVILETEEFKLGVYVSEDGSEVNVVTMEGEVEFHG